MLIKPFILCRLFIRLFCRHFRSNTFQGACITLIRTDHAAIAFTAINRDIFIRVHINRLLWAHLQTVPAVNAAVRHLNQLLLRTDQFRIVAPSAVQRASLQKDSRSNSRAIFGRKFLNCSYKCFHTFLPLQRRCPDISPAG